MLSRGLTAWHSLGTMLARQRTEVIAGMISNTDTSSSSYAAEKEPEGLLCPVEFAEALTDCFHEADKQLLHWLKSMSSAYSTACGLHRQ